MKILLVYWITHSTGSIGIVLGEDGITKEKKAYISSVAGNDKDEDIDHIVKNGAKFSVKAAEALMEGK